MELLNRQCVGGKVKPEEQWKPILLEPPGHENMRSLLWKVAGTNWNQPWRGAMHAASDGRAPRPAGAPHDSTNGHGCWTSSYRVWCSSYRVLASFWFNLPLLYFRSTISDENFYSVFSIASCSLVLDFRRVHCQRLSPWISEGLGSMKQCWAIKLLGLKLEQIPLVLRWPWAYRVPEEMLQF